MRWLAPLLVLAACGAGSAPVYLQPGVPAAQARADLAQCRAEGRAVAPPRAGRISTGVSIGIGRCTGSVCLGTSTTTGTLFDRRERERAEARGEVVGACMGTKGYRLVALPACRGGRGQILASHPFDLRGLCAEDGAVAAPL